MEKKLHNPTLRVLEIFKVLFVNNNGLSFSEISQITGISKGTLHPILTTLIYEDFLQINENKINIGKNCFKIGNAYVHSLDFIDTIKPHMKDIVFVCGEICQLGVLDGSDVLYIEKTEPKQAIKLESYVGKNLPAYATVLGKCLLSGLNDDEIRKLYLDKNSFQKYTQNTVSDISSLLKQIYEVRANGYAHEIAESNKDIECVAVPLRSDGKIIASISVSLPIYRSNNEKIRSIIEILKLQAALIEKENSLIYKSK